MRGHRTGIKTSGETCRTAAGLLALTAWLALAAVLGGCEYAGPEEPPAATAPTSSPASSPASHPAPRGLHGQDPRLAALESGNRAKLGRLLGPVPARVLLDDSGSVGGAAGGFTRNLHVTSAGRYAIRMACVGAPRANLVVRQDTVRAAGNMWNISFDCGAGVAERTLQLQAGPLTVAMMRPYSRSLASAGAVAGFRITSAAP